MSTLYKSSLFIFSSLDLLTRSKRLRRGLYKQSSSLKACICSSANPPRHKFIYSIPSLSIFRERISYPLKIALRRLVSMLKIKDSNMLLSKDVILVHLPNPPNIVADGVAKLLRIPIALFSQIDLK